MRASNISYSYTAGSVTRPKGLQPSHRFERCTLSTRIFAGYTEKFVYDWPALTPSSKYVEGDSLAYIKYMKLDPVRFSHLQMLINHGRVMLDFKEYFSTDYIVDRSAVIFPPRRFGKCLCPYCCHYYGHVVTKAGFGKRRPLIMPDRLFCPGYVRGVSNLSQIKHGDRLNWHAIQAVESYLFNRNNRTEPRSFYWSQLERKYNSTSNIVSYSPKGDTHRGTKIDTGYHFFKGTFLSPRKVEIVTWYRSYRLPQLRESFPALFSCQHTTRKSL